MPVIMLKKPKIIRSLPRLGGKKKVNQEPGEEKTGSTLKLSGSLEKKLTKKQRQEELKNGRRAIVILFIITLVLSLVFYLRAEIPLWWEKISSPFVLSTLPLEGEAEKVTIEAIESLTGELRGVYGVEVYRLEKRSGYGVNANRVFPAASLMKLPVILTLYQQAEAGKVNLETEYVLTEADKTGGAGVLQGQAAGSRYTYRQLAELMAQQSDNTAFGVIRRHLGDELIGKTLQQTGMWSTSLVEFTTTPADISLFFQKLYYGELVSRAYQQEILSMLTKTAFEERLPAGLPEGVRIAHKIGTDLGVYADAGIVYGPEPFVLVVMSKEARETEALSVIPEIARLVWQSE